jgi:glycosyltransferase involved in cell wall biosynthesis
LRLTEKSISVVVACYRDAGSIAEMHRRLTAVLEEITPLFEIVFVNDNSPDNAEELLTKLARRDSRVTVITHSRNFGSQMAFTSGMKQATGDAVVLMDGDLQDPPEVIPHLVREMEKGFEVVYGIRERRKESWLMESARKVFYRLYRRLSYLDMPLDAGDFSIMTRPVVESLLRLPERDRFLRGLRAWVGFRQTGVPYVRPERFSGESTNSFADNLRWAKRGILSFSYRPLEMISLLAFIVTVLAGIAVLGYILAYFLVPNAPRGFMTLLVAILFLGAVQLLSLSVMAEYLGKIFEEVKQRPPFIVRNVLNDHRTPEPGVIHEPDCICGHHRHISTGVSRD